MLESHTFTKQQLPALFAHQGKLVRDGEHAGKLFTKFRGKLDMSTGLYAGTLEFIAPETTSIEGVQVYEEVSYGEIINSTTESEVTDGDTINDY